MKRSYYVMIIFLICSFSAVEAKNVHAYLNYTIFNLPEKGPYIETYLSVSGSSVLYKEMKPGAFQACIEITFIFRQQDSIKEYDKYQLFSPEVADTNKVDFNFLDEQRYFIPEGDYDMEIIISDVNAGKKPFNAIQPVSIRFDQQNVCFSGIQLIESVTVASEQKILTKGGYDLVPMVYYFYPESFSKLIFYSEIYNTEKMLGQGEKFLVTSMIKSFETEITMNDFISYKRMDTKPVVPLLNEFDISRLPSGNYLLVIEARNKQNELIGSNELYFQRSNPSIQLNMEDLAAINITSTFASKITSLDTLREFIQSLYPIATNLENTFIQKQSRSADLVTNQQFFYNFWTTRNLYNPEQAWKDYFEQVQIVNGAYKTPIKKGYETDRGRVYLEYGPPNIISEHYNEPSNFPYEIWQYYQLGGNQRDKKFVFFTNDAITNDFRLLHSDAIGEVSNYRWKIVLSSRWYDPYNLDAQEVPNTWGSEVDDYYNNPR
jgi:GWxTD domain-containing protein